MPSKKHGQLYANLGMPYTKLGRLCSNLGMLHEFAGTPYEGEEGIHEESRGHRAFHGVRFILLTRPPQSRGRAFLVLTTPRPLVSTTLRRSRRRAVGSGRADLVWTTPRLRRGRAVPSRREQRGREEHPSQREAPLREHLGAPSIGFETPHE